MKSVIIVLAFAAIAISCTQPQQASYKTERDEVMKFHDVVMEDHGKLIGNQIKLDELLKNMPALKKQFPAVDTVKEREAMKGVLGQLNKTEDLMNDWMHQFEPDVTGKSNEAAVQYFKKEHAKISSIDSIYKIQVKSSTAYLAQFKK